MQLEFEIKGMDFARAGEAAAKIKKALQMVGMEVETIRKTLVVAYEAELNVVIHAYAGTLTAKISPDAVEIKVMDEGPGIADIELAMQEGYSTAPSNIREMGFGAGMGLPNIERCSDQMELTSEVNQGTLLTAIIFNRTSGEK
ncbi:putative anti-sigma regulatory factor, serine/threonine protein kinase [Desulfofarcimen acetoxidans DSM 771]|uniref:Putative anti-sigma regulatory factor, serine/threonine protein kinase n=1 Tax=Desulfofarcimen acetoxidans (strain ATCC 49208 / DSM 771 / KCTC 5769 / VKM B-1644 / 5575) TaxID=485916 RepID=C8W2X8_DESAS|nr:ATP-binding protein [Desulfofarcimen acetoxidans]ACV61134.1 putative anti-sigma regulatory factor, serine/threonine protein kinase [Desulfofarcimen acetoxidans DSM 771]